MSIEDLMNGTNCNYVGYDSVDTVDKNTKAIEELRQNVNTLNNEVDALSISVTTGDLQADMISATHVDTGTVSANSVDTDVINAKEINLVRDNFIEATNADVGIVSIPENQSIKFYLISDTQSVQVSYTDGSLNVQAKTGNLEKIDVYKEAGRVYFATFINDTERFYYWTELAEDVQPITDLAYLGYALEYSAVIENNGTYFAGEVFGYRNSFGELEANVLTNSEYIYGRDFIDLPETLDPGTEENNVYIKIPKFVGQVKLLAKNLANDELFSMTFNRELSDSDGDVASTLSYTTKDMSYIKDVFSDLEGNLYVATRAFGKLWFSTNTFEDMDVITADQGVSPYIPLDDRLISYQPTLPARHVILGDGTLATGLDIQGELAADIIKLPEGISYENLAVSGTLNAGTVLVENEIEVPPPVADNNATTKLYVDTADEALQTALDTKLTETAADLQAEIDSNTSLINTLLKKFSLKVKNWVVSNFSDRNNMSIKTSNRYDVPTLDYIDNSLSQNLLPSTYTNSNVLDGFNQLYDNVNKYTLPTEVNLDLTERFLLDEEGVYIYITPEINNSFDSYILNINTNKNVSSSNKRYLFPTRSGNNLIISDDSTKSITLPQVDFQRLFPNAYNYVNPVTDDLYYALWCYMPFTLNNTNAIHYRISSINDKYIIVFYTTLSIKNTYGGSLSVPSNSTEVGPEYAELYIEYDLINNKTLQASKAYLRNDSFTSNVDLFPILKDEFGEGGLFYYENVSEMQLTYQQQLLKANLAKAMSLVQ